MMTMSTLGLQSLKTSTAERNAWQVFSPTLVGTADVSKFFPLLPHSSSCQFSMLRR